MKFTTLRFSRFSFVLASLAAAWILSVAAPAHARSVNRTPVVASLLGDLAGMEAAYLLADGRLQIKMQDGTVQTAMLSKLATERLLKEAADLSNVKLDESYTPVMCLMKPAPAMTGVEISGYDPTSDTFNSKLRPVLTADACNVSFRAKPLLASEMNRMLRFRAQLLILTLNALK